MQPLDQIAGNQSAMTLMVETNHSFIIQLRCKEGKSVLQILQFSALLFLSKLTQIDFYVNVNNIRASFQKVTINVVSSHTHIYAVMQ